MANGEWEVCFSLLATRYSLLANAERLMPLVNVMVSGRAYTIACDEGEEEHLKDLATHVDSKVRELLESVGQVGDQRLLLMAALLVTDEYFEARAKLEGHAKHAGDLASAHEEISGKLNQAETQAISLMERSAKRAEDIAARLGHA
jgi:cell division protein ZapA